MRHIPFMLEVKLGIAGDAGSIIGWQTQSLIKRICVQRLRLTSNRRRRLDTGARHIIEHILRRKRPARCLAMGAKHQ